MKRIKDDIGSTIDSEDNLARMIMIEQAIDAATEIDEDISRSYAFCDCIIAIVEYTREVSNEETLQRVPSLLNEITNRGASVRAQSFYALGLAAFEKFDEAEKIITEAINNAFKIKDDFDQRDALLDIATAIADISLIQNNSNLIDTAFNLSNHLTDGQKAYLYGYLSIILSGTEGDSLMREAVEIATNIQDPIIRSKVFLELSGLLTNISKRFEM